MGLFYTLFSARQPDESRESPRKRGTLIQGEETSDIQTILQDLKSLTEKKPKAG